MSIQKNHERIILGIDPGIADLGWGVLVVSGSSVQVAGYGSIKTSSKQKPHIRLIEIYNQLQNVIDEYKPTEVGVEELFFGKNAKTAMTVGEARGVTMLLLAQHGLEPLQFKPNAIKIALTGYGGATKSQMQEMVRRTLELKKIPKPDDAADALAIAITVAVTNSELAG